MASQHLSGGRSPLKRTKRRVATVRPSASMPRKTAERPMRTTRTQIAEFDGGLSRAEAEAQAFGCCVDEWLNHHPVPSPPGRCLACGGGEQAHDALLRHDIEPTGHARLHSRCWSNWHAAREAEAR